MALQLDLPEAELADPMYGDVVKELPDGSRIEIAEVAKTLAGEDCRWFPQGEDRPVAAAGVRKEVWSHYLDFFVNCDELGLPHGRGWFRELPWVTDFLVFMKRQKAMVEAWRIRQASRG